MQDSIGTWDSPMSEADADLTECERIAQDIRENSQIMKYRGFLRPGVLLSAQAESPSLAFLLA